MPSSIEGYEIPSGGATNVSAPTGGQDAYVFSGGSSLDFVIYLKDVSSFDLSTTNADAWEQIQVVSFPFDLGGECSWFGVVGPNAVDDVISTITDRPATISPLANDVAGDAAIERVW